MGFPIRPPEKKERELIPAEAHPAVCNMIVDLGKQYNKNLDKCVHKVVIGFQFPDITVTTQDGKEFRRGLSRRYTASMHEKASLRLMLENWRGKRFTDDELATFDLKDIIGKVALVNVIHNPGKDGKVYEEITSVSPMPKALAGVYSHDGDTVYYSMEENGLDIPEKLPDWMKKLIAESQEFKDARDGAAEAARASSGPGDDLPY